MGYARVFNLPTGDFLDSALAHIGTVGYFLIGEVCGFELLEDVLMETVLHVRHPRPMFGSSQPAYGLNTALPYSVMGNPKKHKLVGVMRAVFSENVQHLLKKRYPKARNETAQRREYEKDSGISKETVRRWLRGESGANLDEIEVAARGFKVNPHELLVPGFGAGRSPSRGPSKPVPVIRPGTGTRPSIDPPTQ